MAARHRRPRHVDVRRAATPRARIDRSRPTRTGPNASPKATCRRRRRGPKGIERNLVVTLWDVGDDHSFMHDEISTGQEPSDGERRRARLRRVGRSRPARRARSEREQDVRARHPDARAEGESPVAVPGAEPSVAALGQRASVGEPAVRSGRSAQPDDRQQGPRVDDVEDPQQSGSVLVQRCHEQVRRMVPAPSSGTAGVVLRSEDEAVHADRHVLLPRTICSSTTTPTRRCISTSSSVPIFGWIDTKVYDQTQGRAEGGRLVRPGARHQRRRQDHEAVERAARVVAAIR